MGKGTDIKTKENKAKGKSFWRDPVEPRDKFHLSIVDGFPSLPIKNKKQRNDAKNFSSVIS